MICCVSKWCFLRRLVVAELVNHVRLDRVLAAPVAEDVPGDLRRTPDEEFEASVVRGSWPQEDGAPPKREAPESKDLRARFPVVCPPAAGGADPDDHGPQRLEAVVGGQGPVESVYRPIQNLFCGRGKNCVIDNGGTVCMIQRRQSS